MTDEKKIQDQYDSMAEAYHQKRYRPDESLWNDHLDLPMVIKLLKNGSVCFNKSILDLGCGSGILAAKLKRYSPKKITGIDLSEKLLVIARRSYADIEFIQGSALKIPKAEGEFDVIVSALVMHYISDVSEYFKEVARVLKPGGVFAFTFHHPFMEVMKIDDNQAILAPTYFEEKSYEWEMSQGEKLLSYHHTFETVLNSLVPYFKFEMLVEARAPESFKESESEFYRRAGLYPNFSGIRAIKL